MNLSPWFKASEQPVRNGKYQVKDWAGCITECEWDGKDFLYVGHRVLMNRICAWRGVMQP